MAENILEKIIRKKSEKIANLKKTISLESLDELINTNKTFVNLDRKSTRLNSSHSQQSRMPSSA